MTQVNQKASVPKGIESVLFRGQWDPPRNDNANNRSSYKSDGSQLTCLHRFLLKLRCSQAGATQEMLRSLTEQAEKIQQTSSTSDPTASGAVFAVGVVKQRVSDFQSSRSQSLQQDLFRNLALELPLRECELAFPLLMLKMFRFEERENPEQGYPGKT
ncbi:hypothetical protein P5673_023021 [Acropora cervicornis]|uniref:Uncharacterized protein n=1 Tax=Acropora cervicornis TaxID=6130 RepID=A0AAD9Q5Y1_ACRCE|nr:hypothetical protein P5673_023021 [Acropora cervicornis]